MFCGPVHMEVADVIPFVWCAAALAAAVRSRGGGRLWWATAAFASMLASLHQWRWNKPVYEAGRAALIDLGVYDERLVFKVAIGLVSFAALSWFAWRTRRWRGRLPPLHRLAWLAMFVDALYVTVRTLSIDGWLPIALGVEPGKSLLGLSLASAAVAAVAFAKGAPPDVDDDAP